MNANEDTNERTIIPEITNARKSSLYVNMSSPEMTSVMLNLDYVNIKPTVHVNNEAWTIHCIDTVPAATEGKL